MADHKRRANNNPSTFGPERGIIWKDFDVVGPLQTVAACSVLRHRQSLCVRLIIKRAIYVPVMSIL
jgi:hypothetical protein